MLQNYAAVVLGQGMQEDSWKQNEENVGYLQWENAVDTLMSVKLAMSCLHKMPHLVFQ